MEHFQIIALVILLLVLGLLMLIRPDVVWKMEHFFSVRNGEPTDWYLAITRLIGLGCIFAAVIVSIVFFCF